ncbi:MAG: hypothetical protein GXP37_13240 [Chloroflexi bacterium]|nr:hypothetical protein [Chloroflexota bacterium]
MNEVQQSVEQHRQTFLEELIVACSLPSVSEQMADLQKVAAWIRQRLQRAGCEVTLWENENIRLNDYFQHIVYLVSLIRRFATT